MRATIAERLGKARRLFIVCPNGRIRISNALAEKEYSGLPNTFLKVAFMYCSLCIQYINNIITINYMKVQFL